MWSLWREVGSSLGHTFCDFIFSSLAVGYNVTAESQQGWSRNYPLWLEKSPGQRLKTFRSVQTFFKVRKQETVIGREQCSPESRFPCLRTTGCCRLPLSPPQALWWRGHGWPLVLPPLSHVEFSGTVGLSFLMKTPRVLKSGPKFKF